MSVYSEIAELAEELCEPHVHTERVPTWDKNRNKKYVVHRTTQPGLLAQLYQAAVDPVSTPGAATSHSKLQSRPPLAVAALSVYFDICAGAQRWVREFEMEVRVGPESNIRALIGMVGRIPDGVLEDLLRDLRMWRRWCAAMTGWKEKSVVPSIGCPACSMKYTVIVNFENKVAFCKQCSATWEGEELYDMAEQVKSAA